MLYVHACCTSVLFCVLCVCVCMCVLCACVCCVRVLHVNGCGVVWYVWVWECVISPGQLPGFTLGLTLPARISVSPLNQNSSRSILNAVCVYYVRPQTLGQGDHVYCFCPGLGVLGGTGHPCAIISHYKASVWNWDPTNLGQITNTEWRWHSLGQKETENGEEQSHLAKHLPVW